MFHRARGQSLVEFGIIALLLCLLLFGIADFGMLLNGWISVSSGSGTAARQASVGADLGTSVAPAPGTIYHAVENSRVPGISACSADAPQPCARPLKLVAEYVAVGGGVTNYCRGFNNPPSSTSYSVVVRSSTVTCAADTAVPAPATGDKVTITMLANTFEVATPLIRPFFGCTDGTQRHCFVPLSSSTSVRYEGPAIP